MRKESRWEAARWRPLLLYGVLPVAYVVIGRLGLLLGLSPGYATAVFLPAGIAVGAAFITGMPSLPGIFIGSFLLNAWVGYADGHELSLGGMGAAVAIALASMLQAGIGGKVLRQAIGYPTPLDSPRELSLFLLLSPLICLTSATLSSAALGMMGVIESNAVAVNWRTWWAGDTLGVLTVLPIMLVLGGEPKKLWRLRLWYVALPIILGLTLFVATFIWVDRETQSLAEFNPRSELLGWFMLAGGVLAIGLFGAFLMLGTGYAYRIRAKEQELKAIIDRTPFMLARCSRDLKFLFVSRSSARLFRLPLEDIIGKPIAEIMGEEAFKTILPFVERVLRGEELEYETDIPYKGAGKRRMRVIYTPEKNEQGEIEGWVASITDVTEQRRVEAQLVRHLGDLDRLYQLSLGFLRKENGFQQNLADAVTAAIEISGADKGNLQLLESSSGIMKTAAYQGFEQAFLRFFELVRDNASACAAALRSGARVVVEDVTKSEMFDAQSRKVMLDAEARAVVSMPLLSSRGTALGVISVHFRKPHRPVEPDLTRLQLLALQTADYIERRRAEEIETTLVRELQHRSNNLLAVVQSMVRRTISSSRSLPDAKRAVEGRLQALARANQLLMKSQGRNIDLAEIVRAELSLFPTRTKFEGSQIDLMPQDGQRFAFLVHELMTNAIKYGALSSGNGRVKVFWKLRPELRGAILNFRWEERGGPEITAPGTRGFGIELIANIFPQSRIEYETGGLTYEVDVSLAPAQEPALDTHPA
jgi:PAS domain S-box-containing protein